MERSKIKNITLSGMFLALGLLLPTLTGGIPEIGSRLLPMHLPVLLCGFVCGWPYGLVVGFVTPLLRSLLFMAPPLYPIAVAMAFELAAYGVLTGILYRVFPKKILFIYTTLVLSMLGGRLVWGGVQMVLLGLGGKPFTWAMFVAGGFVNAVPGIVLQLVLIPVLIIALRNSRLIGKDG